MCMLCVLLINFTNMQLSRSLNPLHDHTVYRSIVSEFGNPAISGHATYYFTS